MAIGIVLLALSASILAKCGLGMSMVVTPAYILHVKLSQTFSWISFGVADYGMQILVTLGMVIAYKKFSLKHAAAFVTTLIYSLVLDGTSALIKGLSADTLIIKILLFVIGRLIGSLALAFLYHSYLPPQPVDLVVKEIALHRKAERSKVKLCYDITSLAVSVILSFAFFGFGTFVGVGVGTFISAFVNGPLMGWFTKKLDKVFVYKDAFGWRKRFE